MNKRINHLVCIWILSSLIHIVLILSHINTQLCKRNTNCRHYYYTHCRFRNNYHRKDAKDLIDFQTSIMDNKLSRKLSLIEGNTLENSFHMCFHWMKYNSGISLDNSYISYPNLIDRSKILPSKLCNSMNIHLDMMSNLDSNQSRRDYLNQLCWSRIDLGMAIYTHNIPDSNIDHRSNQNNQIQFPLNILCSCYNT